MDKVKTKIIGTDYYKFFRVFIPLSVIFMTAGAAMGELAVPVHSVEAFIFIVAYGGVCLLIMGIYWLAVAAWLYKKGEEAEMHLTFCGWYLDSQAMSLLQSCFLSG